VSGSEDGDIRVWDLETGEVLNIMSGHTKTVVALFYNPTDSSILSASFDGTIKVCYVSSSTLLLFCDQATIRCGIKPQLALVLVWHPHHVLGMVYIVSN